jgi:hypothetical protein
MPAGKIPKTATYQYIRIRVVIVTDAVPPIWAKSRSPPWNNAVRRRHSIRVKLRRAAHRIDLEVSIDPLPEQRVRDGIKLSGRCVFAGLTGS